MQIMRLDSECDFIQIQWTMSAQELHDFIRGNDKLPGAWAEHEGQVIF